MRPIPGVVVVAALAVVTSAVAVAQEDGARDAPPPLLDAAAAGPASHIWHAGGGGTVFFRRKFELPAGARRLRVVASCDDLCQVYFDGEAVAAASAWETLIVADLDADDRRAGKLAKAGGPAKEPPTQADPGEAAGQPAPTEHVIAVRGTDRGGAAALAVWVLWEDADGRQCFLVSDAEWRCSIEAAADWTAVAFDDTGWGQAQANGTTPFTKTTYGHDPVNYVVVDRYAEMVAAIERAVQAMRGADGDDDRALRALGEIERAVVRARQAIWERRQRQGKAGKAPREGGR